MVVPAAGGRLAARAKALATVPQSRSEPESDSRCQWLARRPSQRDRPARREGPARAPGPRRAARRAGRGHRSWSWSRRSSLRLSDARAPARHWMRLGGR
jgi:hypothetical protein